MKLAPKTNVHVVQYICISQKSSQELQGRPNEEKIYITPMHYIHTYIYIYILKNIRMNIIV
jgi:hypothetical protein